MVRRLLQVPFALRGGTRGGLADTLAELAPCPPLPQQIPALIESLLDRPQGRVLLLGRQLAAGQLVPKLALGLDELIDAPDYLLVVHPTNPSDRRASPSRLRGSPGAPSLRPRRCRAPTRPVDPRPR